MTRFCYSHSSRKNNSFFNVYFTILFLLVINSWTLQVILAITCITDYPSISVVILSMPKFFTRFIFPCIIAIIFLLRAISGDIVLCLLSLCFCRASHKMLLKYSWRQYFPKFGNFFPQVHFWFSLSQPWFFFKRSIKVSLSNELL